MAAPSGPPMDHTPTTPASDDRPLRILERTPVPDDHKERLASVVRKAQQVAAMAGAELQSEFGKDHVGLIVGCNQFVRLMRAGEAPGTIELFLEPADREGLRTSGFTLKEPEGAVFKLFGWVRIDPMEGALPALEQAVEKAFQKAMRKK